MKRHRKTLMLAQCAAQCAALIGGCAPTETSVGAAIDNANYCQEAADCEDVGPDCPFGCSIPVNVNEAAYIRDLIETFGQAQGQVCMYRCNPTEGIACQDGRCVTRYPDP